MPSGALLMSQPATAPKTRAPRGTATRRNVTMIPRTVRSISFRFRPSWKMRVNA